MDDKYYMRKALELAKKAYELDEVPIGCVIVYNNKIIAGGYNRKELDSVATYHAEMIAINDACKKLSTWRLDSCTLYTTMEPCMMCTGAIIQARIGKVVYGTNNDSFGYLSKIGNQKNEIIGGVLNDECLAIVSNFFKEKRN